MRIFVLLFFSSLFANPQVYDCFLFNNELGLLEVRLHEMDSQVDKFVIVEAVETFQGGAKPLIFAENAEKFAEFKDKIIHVVVEHLETSNPWDREFNQREAVHFGLKDCKPDDIIILSDCDEIIRNEGVKSMKEVLSEGCYSYVRAQQHLHTNFMNTPPGENGTCSIATTYSMVQGASMQALRMRGIFAYRENSASIPIVATGWHFAWVGDSDFVGGKCESFSHSEMNNPETIEWARGIGFKRLWSRTVIEIDDYFPKYLQDNIEYFEAIGLALRPETQARIREDLGF